MVTWSTSIPRSTSSSSMSREILACGNAAADGLPSCFREQINRRRRHPEEGFLDYLIAAEHEGGRLY